jgi:lipopolysaccharide transport system ATP-binding protein
MSTDNVVLAVEHLAKHYRLGSIGTTTFYADLQRWWADLRGRPDSFESVSLDGSHLDTDKSIWALKDISFKVRPGEVLGILGANGSGKSTLLKIISRVTAPTEGVVRIRGNVSSLLEVGTGFHQDFTGRENIYMSGSILGMSKAVIDSALDEIIEFSGIRAFIDTPVKRYSSGMYVRLAFSVAAHLTSEIVIVDEVLAVGDQEFRRKCLDKMAEIARSGRTVLFVSHNMENMRNLCDRSILLDHGRIVKHGDTKEVVKQYLSSVQLSSSPNKMVL